MRRFVLGVILAAGLTMAASSAASAQFIGAGGLGFPPGVGGGGGAVSAGAGGPFFAGNYPFYNSVNGVGMGPPYGPYGIPSASLADPYGYGYPASYQYPYGFQFGTPPYYGVNGGVGYTFNSLNNAPFGTGITSTNTSTLPSVNGFARSITVLPLSALGRISQIPTSVTNSVNDVVIR